MSREKGKAPPTFDDQATDEFDSGKPRRVSAQLEAISMKTPGAEPIAADQMRAQPALKRPQLRAISEVTPQKAQSLGYLAPPADPAQLRARRVRDAVLIGSLSLIVASIVALVIWFVAR